MTKEEKQKDALSFLTEILKQSELRPKSSPEQWLLSSLLIHAAKKSGIDPEDAKAFALFTNKCCGLFSMEDSTEMIKPLESEKVIILRDTGATFDPDFLKDNE